MKFYEVLAGCTVHDTSIKSLSRVLVSILIGLLKAVNVQNIGGGVLEMRKAWGERIGACSGCWMTS